MPSILVSVVILVVIGVWGVWESGRRFRRAYTQRGKSWEAVCSELEGGKGTLIVDTILGPQRGLGHPVIWWVPELAAGADIAAHIESETASAMLVRCPRPYRSLEALRSRFGERRVVAHSWDFGVPVDVPPRA